MQAHNPPPQKAHGVHGPEPDPIEGFRQALKDALKHVQDHGWQPGQTYDTVIELHAKISVHNPGRIDEYKVIIGGGSG